MTLPSRSEESTARSVPKQRDGRPDIAALMAEIRQELRTLGELDRNMQGPAPRHSADADRGAPCAAGELVNSEHRIYLNRNFERALQLDVARITSHRPGVLGRAIVFLKRKVLTAFWNRIIGHYVESQREFNLNLVQFINQASSYIDTRDAAIFWELIRKIDYDNTKLTERVDRLADEQGAALCASERRVHDDLNASIRALREDLTKASAVLGEQTHRLQTVESVASGLESIVARAAKPPGSGAALNRPAHDAGAEQGVGAGMPDLSYLLLENRFRGSEAEISERLKIYPPYFAGAEEPVLDIGGGRGELLDLFRKAGVPAYAVDFDRAMVDAACAKGLDARHGDGIAHLAGLPDRALSGVIAVQVVEHLTREQLERLFELCCRKVKAGGKVIFETINPQSIVALSSNYFRDPTHVWPLHPDTMSYRMALAGLVIREVRMLSPVPAEAQLQTIPVDEHLTPRWAFTIGRLNHNVEQLNRLLFGYQDYCIVAEVR